MVNAFPRRRGTLIGRLFRALLRFMLRKIFRLIALLAIIAIIFFIAVPNIIRHCFNADVDYSSAAETISHAADNISTTADSINSFKDSFFGN